WVNRRPRSRGRQRDRRLRVEFTSHAVRWLTFLGRLQPLATVERPYAEHVAQFADSMLRERGLSPRTVAYDSRTTHQFLGHVEDLGLRLEVLTVTQVDELLAKKVRDAGYARTTIQRWTSALRRFFRFAEGRGWCRKGLAVAITAPRVFA